MLFIAMLLARLARNVAYGVIPSQAENEDSLPIGKAKTSITTSPPNAA
jgi:hypothetical protein